jgi:hypothetical protein
MNLFILSLCATECAEFMFDKHVVKIILEAVQMLSTALQVLEPNKQLTWVDKLYKVTHVNHPVSVWVRSSYENFMFTINLVDAMHEEWKYRYQHPETKIHKSYEVLMYIKTNIPDKSLFLYIHRTPFATAMPDEFKSGDPVQSYRNYYQSDSKKHLASWKRRGKPSWWIADI